MLIRYLAEYINVTHKLGKFFIQEIFISGEIIVVLQMTLLRYIFSQFHKKLYNVKIF